MKQILAATGKSFNKFNARLTVVCLLPTALPLAYAGRLAEQRMLAREEVNYLLVVGAGIIVILIVAGLIFFFTRFRTASSNEGGQQITEQTQAQQAQQSPQSSLENQVAERTAELLETNALLKQEISTRTRIETALRNSELRFRSLIEGNADGIVIVNKQGKLRYINPAAETLLSRRAQELIDGIFGFPLVVGETTELDIIRQQERNIDISLVAEMRVTQTFWESETVYLATLHDVTARVQVERLLRMQRDLGVALSATRTLTDAVAQVLDAVLQIAEIDCGGVYLVNPVNGELELVSHEGLSPEFVTNISRYSPDSFQTRLVMAGEPVYQQYTEFQPNPTLHQIEALRALAIIPVKNEGEIIAALNLASHIHDEIPANARHALESIAAYIGGVIGRLRAEQTLTEQAQKLVRSNEELHRFFYVASHHLQEPLRIVTSYAQLLARRYGEQFGSDADTFITFIVKEATYMKSLLQDLQTYAQIDQYPKGFARVSCDAILDGVLWQLQHTIKEQGAIVTRDPLPPVIGNAIQRGQVFENLIMNALKFQQDSADDTEESSASIHISAQSQVHVWLFKVQDNGIGIAPAQIERLFQIFQRLHTREEYPGTGIGLAICKKIIERHGGHIWVESKLEKGSTFYFTIPKQAQYAQTEPLKPQEENNDG